MRSCFNYSATKIGFSKLDEANCELLLSSQAALHRRLLNNIPDTFLVTIPDDAPIAAYFAAAQIVYWRLF
jgi:hypothetical protein